MDGLFGGVGGDLPPPGFGEDPGWPSAKDSGASAMQPMDTEENSVLGEEATQASSMLEQLEKSVKMQEGQITELYDRQRQALAQKNVNMLEQLKNDAESALQTLKNQHDSLTNVIKTVLLGESDLSRAFQLKDDLRLQRVQLQLALTELGHAANIPNALRQPNAALVILKQPFPCVYTKGKSVEPDELQLKVFLSPAAQCKPAGPCVAEMQMDPEIEAKAKGSKKGGGTAPLSNVKANFGANMTATLAPKFELGSRKTEVTLQFKVPVVLGGRQFTLESDESEHVVVITNECQWEGSEGMLLKRSIFGSAREVPYVYFANMIQRHFLIVTRQDLDVPARGLSRLELMYFFNNLLGRNQVIDGQGFDRFWDWYGKCIQTLRYQRHICSLWTGGLLMGFADRQEVQSALHGREPGTFLIRFSERHAGQFAIAYVGFEIPRGVKHYLVQPTDTASAKKTLPDFLSECHQFQKVLELTNSPQGRVLRVVPKDDAFGEFYSKVDRVDPGPGYEQLLRQPL